MSPLSREIGQSDQNILPIGVPPKMLSYPPIKRKVVELGARTARLAERAKGRPVRLGILSMYDVENNAVRILAATLRAAGHEVTEIYFKDWISNHLAPASDTELANLTKLAEDRQLDIVCISLRASAYFHSARIITQHLHATTELAVLWGGMHPTLVPDECMEFADLVLEGEAEHAITDFADRLRDGVSIHDCGNVRINMADGSVVSNPLRPLITDLDTLEFRDYTSHEDKFFIWGSKVDKGDPMHGDPVFQMMGSRGCIYKCSYCYNSTYKASIYPKQKWFRVRSPQSMIDEIKAAREHWDFKRVRFDDEVFFFQKRWLAEFCELFPREIGLPFEIFIEPKLVTEERISALKKAGLTAIYMGIQASERVTEDLYDRNVKTTTLADISKLFKRYDVKPHYQLIFDDPVSTEGDKRALFEMILEFPRPFDLYLFSMTVFPGSELSAKLLEEGVISEYDIEGANTRVFYQHRVNLEYPRPVEDTFWITLIQMLSKDFVPRPVLKQLAKSKFLKRHPWPLVKIAHTTNYVKMGQVASKMLVRGEMTKTLWRRWASAERVITS